MAWCFHMHIKPFFHILLQKGQMSMFHTLKAILDTLYEYFNMAFETVDDRDLDIGGWNNPSHQTPRLKKPVWREDPSTSLSDWKIIVEVDDENESCEHESPSTYYTHKCYLALGERGSQYFATLFQLPLQTAEAENAETVLKLPALCVPLFPSFLDFVYEGTLDLAKDNVVPLMELARRFGNAALGKQAEAWAQNNLWENIEDCALVMLEHSVQLNVEQVKNASIKIVAKHFTSLSRDYLAKFPHKVLLELCYLNQSYQLKLAEQVYRFTVCSEETKTSYNGAFIFSRNNNSVSFAIAEPALSTSVSYWNIEILSGDLFFGIIDTKTPRSNSDATTFGWNEKGVFSKCIESPTACQEWMDINGQRLQEGDIVMMKLDSASNKLTMKHKRHQRRFEMMIDYTNSSSTRDWYIFVILKGASSCLVHGSSKKEYEELQF